MQVYLKQYFELFSLFDDIDSGCAAHGPSGINRHGGRFFQIFGFALPSPVCLSWDVTVFAISDDKRIDLAEFKQAVPLLVSHRRWMIASTHRSLTRPLAACRLGGAFRSPMRKRRSRRSTGITSFFFRARCFPQGGRRSNGAERRNEGGQILFIEFCDWAIKKQLGKQEDGGVAAPHSKGGGAGQGLATAPEAVTPSAAARSTRPRSATRDRPARATPLAVSKSQEYGGIIEKHSDYRWGDAL